MTPETQQILILLGACLLAFLAGIGLAVFGARQNTARLRQTEHELATTREELEQYRKRVAEHFDGTSRLLHDLTLQYRAVYEHLAEGAQSLCPDGSNLLAPSLAQAALPEASKETDDAGPEPAEAAGTDPGDELEPLLDPESPAQTPSEAGSETRV